MERQLANDLKAVLKEAETLIDSTSGVSDGKLAAAREKLGQTLQTLRGHWERLEDKTSEAADAARRVVREHPYETVGAGLLTAAFIAGAIWMRRHVR